MPGGESRFITEELKKLKVSLDLIIQVVKQIDARLLAHVPPI